MEEIENKRHIAHGFQIGKPGREVKEDWIYDG